MHEQPGEADKQQTLAQNASAPEKVQGHVVQRGWLDWARGKTVHGRHLVLLGLLALAVWWYVSTLLSLFKPSHYPTDFKIMFRAAQALHDVGLPYDLENLRATPFGHYYNKPPLFVSLLSLTVPLGVDRVYQGWTILNQLFYLSTFLVLCRALYIRVKSPPGYTLGIAFLLFQPTAFSLSEGQLDCLLLLLLSLAWMGIARGRDGVAGVMIAVATMLKLYPGLAVLFFLLRRRWCGIGWYIAACILLTILSGTLSGWDTHRVFVTSVLPEIAGGVGYIENQSLFGFFARLYVDGLVSDTHKVLVPEVTLLHRIASLLVLSATAILGYVTRDERAAFSGLICASLLVTPIAWVHYEVILLLPLAVLLVSWSDGERNWVDLAILCAGGLLLTFGNHRSVWSEWWPLQSWKLYAILAIWLLSLSRMVRARGAGRGSGANDRDLSRSPVPHSVAGALAPSQLRSVQRPLH